MRSAILTVFQNPQNLWRIRCMCAILAVFGVLTLSVSVSLADETEQGEFAFARQLSGDGLYELAAQEFRRFVENHPNSTLAPDAQLEIARAYGSAASHARAADAYQGFLVKHPQDVRVREIWFKVGDHRMKARQYDEAARSYQELAETYPESDFADRALVRSAEAHIAAGHPDRTFRLLSDLIERYTKSGVLSRAKYLLATEKWRRGDAEGALRLVGQVFGNRNRSSDAADALALATEIHLAREEIERARYYSDRLVSVFPSDRRTWTARIAVAEWYRTHAAALGTEDALNQAAEVLRDAHRRAPDPAQGERALFALASVREEQGLSNMAESNWHTFIQMYRTSANIARAQVGLGRSQLAGGKEQQGVFTLEDVLSSQDTAQVVNALETLAEHYLGRQDHVTGAEYLRRMIAMGADSRRLRKAYLKLAHVYNGPLGERERAMELFGQLADGNDAVAAKAQFALAAGMQRQGLVEAAERGYWRLRRRFPENDLAKAAEDSITYIKLFLTKNFSGAIEDLTAVVRSIYGPEGASASAVAPLELATITVERLKDYEAAIPLLVAYLSQEERVRGDEAEHLLAKCYLNLATKARLKRDSQAESQNRLAALAALRRLANEYPSSSLADDAYIETVDARLSTLPESERHVRAVEDYGLFLNRFPTSDRLDHAWVRLAEASLAQAGARSGALDAALEWAERVLSERPQSRLLDRALFTAAEARRLQNGQEEARALYQRVIAERPFSAHVPESRFRLGELYGAAGQPRLAARELEKLLRSENLPRPRHVIQRLLVVAWEAAGDFNSSGDVAGRMSKSDDPEIVAWGARHWAKSLVSLNQYARADSVLSAELAARPSAPDADSLSVVLSEVLMETDNSSRALKVLLRFERAYPTSTRVSEVWQLLADVSFQTKSYDVALDYYRKVLNSTPDMREAQLGVLTTLYRLGRTSDALQLRESIERSITLSPEELVRLSYEEGQALWKNKQYEDAIDQFQRVVDQSPNSSWADDALFAQGMCAASSGRGDVAVRAFELLLRDYRQSRLYVRAALELGNAYFGSAHYEFAADAYHKVIEAAPGDSMGADATWNSMLAYEKASRLDAANRYGNLLIEEYPDHPQVLRAKVKIGLNLASLGEYASAIEHLEGILQEVDGHNEGSVRFNLGEAYFNQGRYQEAIVEWLKLAYFNLGGSESASTDEFRMMDQWRATGKWRAAQAYEKWGKTAQACNLYQQMVTRYGSTSDWGRSAAQRMGTLCTPPTASAAGPIRSQ